MVAATHTSSSRALRVGTLADSLALRSGYALAKVAPAWVQGALRNPCFIVGCGRSGSTFLRRALATHPALAVFPSEANRYWHPDLYPWVSRKIDTPPLWIDPFEFSRVSAEHWSADRAIALRKLFGAFQMARRGSVFINKSAMIHFMLSTVDETFPGARFVHLVRDGRAVALSYAKRMGGVQDSEQQGFDETLDATSRYWQVSVSQIGRQVSDLGLQDRFLELRYEDLCAEPTESFSNLARFLDVQVDPLLRFKAGRFRPMNHKFLDELSPSTLERIGQLMHEGLVDKGYTGDV